MMKFILGLIISLSYSGVILSHEQEQRPQLVQSLTVQSLTTNKSQGHIVLFFFEKAAFHQAPLDMRPCFNKAFKANKQVEVTMDPISLVISKCKILD